MPKRGSAFAGLTPEMRFFLNQQVKDAAKIQNGETNGSGVDGGEVTNGPLGGCE